MTQFVYALRRCQSYVKNHWMNDLSITYDFQENNPSESI